MTVRYHPAFAQDIRRFAADYQAVSAGFTGRPAQGCLKLDAPDAVALWLGA